MPHKKQHHTDTPGDATIVIDARNVIESINDQAVKLLELEHDDFSGEDLDVLFPGLEIREHEQTTVFKQHTRQSTEKQIPVTIRSSPFSLKGERYSLLFLHRKDRDSETEMDPEKLLNELLDTRFALDESTIVAITDQTGKIKYVNDKFCQVSKYTKDELIGEDHRLINSGYHSKDFMRNLWRTIANGNVWQGDIKNKAKDGTYYWVDTTIVPFLNKQGKPYQYLAVRKEITDYKRVVEELKHSVQELVDIKFALDESSIVAITDRRGKITYVNDQFVQISKYEREELIGNTHALINSGYHPKSFFKELWRTIGTGSVWKGEIKNKAKDGTYYWVDTTIVPFLNEAGKPYQYLAIRFEITRRKRIEEELQQTMTRIIHVQEEERKRLSRELHDGIGQNLYSHLITINRLSAEYDHPLVSQMLQEATEIIQEVRDFSWELRPSVLDDLGLVPAIRSFLNKFAEHYGINVYFDSSLVHRPDSKVEITIYRIIQESLTNIRKYANVQEASVIIREDDRQIRVVIEDKGNGFDKEELSRGVGLISMEERAKSVNGNLDVNTKPDEGTRVILDIPNYKEASD
ncbi:PAS domain-containing sensor histidine kinase [Sediminibacillus massiliensis]|uniref:PAS domain-containing sensor histidine kinase n=1 Tax=Sediminibacillus massiliensis TaxID=1926277 RepID=UPI00098868DD|nr:PAS domain-containing protein [Sediminibacillus massiliensis]